MRQMSKKMADQITLEWLDGLWFDIKNNKQLSQDDYSLLGQALKDIGVKTEAYIQWSDQKRYDTVKLAWQTQRIHSSEALQIPAFEMALVDAFPYLRGVSHSSMHEYLSVALHVCPHLQRRPLWPVLAAWCFNMYHLGDTEHPHRGLIAGLSQLTELAARLDVLDLDQDYAKDRERDVPPHLNFNRPKIRAVETPGVSDADPSVKETVAIQVTGPEFDMIMAALSIVSEDLHEIYEYDGFHEIATRNYEHKGLDQKQLNALMERIYVKEHSSRGVNPPKKEKS